jgi:hypothetical protein
MESRIGLYWLHKLGIVSLVLGMSFLLMYSFQYFGPSAKLVSGLVVAATLLVLGRRMSRVAENRWFGYGLTAGGWSLAYFATYAAYYLPSVHVITSLPVESVLLIAVAGGSLLSAVRARSQLMAIYSITLATGSILLSGPGLLSDVSFLIIALVASILGNRQSWRVLFAFGLFCCYLGHFYCASAVSYTFDTVQSDTASAFVAAIWLVFTIGLGYSVHATDTERKFITIMSLTNALALVAGVLIFPGGGMLNTIELLLASAGAVYLSAAKWLSRRSETQLTIVHSMIGLSLINIAKLVHFSGVDLVVVDIVEIALLGAIGARFGLRTFRWFAVGLTILLFPLLIVGANENFSADGIFYSPSYAHLAIYATFALAGLASLHIRSRNLLLPDIYRKFYYWAANLMCMFLFSLLADPSAQFLAFTVQTVINHVIAMKLRQHFYGFPGTTAAVIAIYLLPIDAMWHTVPVAAAVLVLYAGHTICRIFAHDQENHASSTFQPVYAHAANLLLTAFILRLVSHNYVSAGLGVEGIVLLLVGFALNDTLFRFTGLGVLAILSGKLLLIDFSKFDTLERIISFIAAGVIFLLASYAYTRFSHGTNAEPNVEDVFDSGIILEENAHHLKASSLPLCDRTIESRGTQ